MSDQNRESVFCRIEWFILRTLIVLLLIIAAYKVIRAEWPF